jgi:hemerythrin-like domain-containing protein
MRQHANALDILRSDHRELQRIFLAMDGAGGKDEEKLCREMVDALRMHTRIEEEVFYPWLREATDEAELLEEASVEHGAAKQLIRDLESRTDAVHRHAVMKVLGEYVGHHIREEEDRIFPLAERTGADMEALGEEMLEHREAPGGGRTDRQGAGDEREFIEAHRDGLSRSTQRAKWIHSPQEREDHPGQTLATRNPDVIRAWAEERRARPATIPGGDPANPRVLHFDFPDYDGGLQPVSWDAWLRVFQDRELVFLFQQHRKDRRQSNFFRLDSPYREDG